MQDVPILARVLDAFAVQGALSAPELLTVLALVALRLLPLVVLSTLFSSLRGPTIVGIPLVQTIALVALSLGLLPSALASAATLPQDALGLTTNALRELALGLSFAVAASVPLIALAQLGPTIESLLTLQRSSLNDAFTLFASALFVATGGLRVLVAAFARSLARAPIGAQLEPQSLLDTLDASAHGLTSVLALGVAFASPVLVALVVFQVGIALSSRAAGSFELTFAERPLRLAVVLIALLGSLSWISLALNEALVQALMS